MNKTGSYVAWRDENGVVRIKWPSDGEGGAVCEHSMV